jgi:tRNA modification GTPase
MRGWLLWVKAHLFPELAVYPNPMARALSRLLFLWRPPPHLLRRRPLNPSTKLLSTRAKALASGHSLILPGDDSSPPPSPSRCAVQPPPDWGAGGSPGTIAAIVTSLGGGPAAVGIVRLSGAEAVAVVGRVFRPARKEPVPWKPRSHFVEYGFALDGDGSVIDEVLRIYCSLSFSVLCAY